MDDDAGCGHTNNGNWVYTGHSSLPNPGTPDIYRCNLPDHSNHGSYVDDLHTECSMWVELPECSDGQHRHGSGACEADHEPDPVCPAVVTVAVTLTWTGHDSDGNDVTKTLDCPVTECQTGQHKHGTDPCHADHAPSCITGLASDQTGSWTPTPNHGHASVTLPGCDPVTVTNCGSGQHSHAPAVPGGHQGCRTAHTAPSCTWNSAGTWTPGHGGQASDGHTTTTGMRVCVSVRHFCIDSGGNILAETVDRQTGTASPDDRGLLPAGYHRDRIPHSTNLGHTQFLPRLTLGGQLSPAGRSRIPAGEWVTATAGCNTNSHTDTAQTQLELRPRLGHKQEHRGHRQQQRALRRVVSGCPTTDTPTVAVTTGDVVPGLRVWWRVPRWGEPSE